MGAKVQHRSKTFIDRTTVDCATCPAGSDFEDLPDDNPRVLMDWARDHIKENPTHQVWMEQDVYRIYTGKEFKDDEG